MNEKLFPRWGAALFALLPLAELLYTPVTGQTMYAAALASLSSAILCAVGAAFAPLWRQFRVLQWGLALFALFPLTRSLSRIALFTQNTLFPNRPLWSLVLVLIIVTFLLSRIGFTRCAMWALPVAWTAGIIVLLSGILTMRDLRIAYWQSPARSLLSETSRLLSSLLPAALALSISLPEPLSGAAARGFSIGGALFALLCLRTELLLGTHTAALLPYPNFSAAGLAALGDFARHGEVFFALPLLLCDIGRAAALACVLFSPLAHRRNKRGKLISSSSP